MQERNQGQCIRRVREECKIGDELIFGADLKVVTGLRLSVAHGILLHSHKSSVLVRLGIGIPLLQCFQMAVVFLQFVPVFFQFLQLFAFLFSSVFSSFADGSETCSNA